MKLPKKTLLAAGVVLVFGACGDSCSYLTKAEFQEYRDSVLNVQLDSIANWIDSTMVAMAYYNMEILRLRQLHGLTGGGVGPPPDPCPGPNQCDW